MKTLNKLSFILLVSLLLIPFSGKAQDKNMYFNGDWQFNIPTGNDFTNRGSGWGMNFDLGTYVTPNIGVGVFMAFSTNHKYIPAETILSGTSSLTVSQQRSLFQLPFGVEARYRFMPDGMFDPYLGLRLGANYAKLTSYFSAYEAHDKTWGFYLSPEIGTNVWVSPNKKVAAHVALYYSFATNKGSVLNGSIHNLNNIGFRLGLAF
ncbi:MAG: outer membrane beta-barrel protein [Bacteroidales bacterium]